MGRGHVVVGRPVEEPYPQRETEARQRHEHKRNDERDRQFAVDHTDHDQDARQHHRAGDHHGERVAGGQGRVVLAAAAESESGGRARGESADQARDRDAGLGAKQAHHDVSDEAQTGNQHHHQPGRVGVECGKRPKVLVRHQRQHHPRDGDELQRGADVVDREGARPGVDGLLEADHDRGGGGDEDGGLHVVPLHERTEQAGEQRGREGRAAGVAAAGVLEMQGGEVHADQRDHNGKHRGGVVVGDERAHAAQDRPEGVGAHAAKIGLAGGGGFLIAPLADQSHERAEAGAQHDRGGKVGHFDLISSVFLPTKQGRT